MRSKKSNFSLMTDGPQRLKMSAFAAESGVPVPTIKHYVRERLLPEPVRTSRNMAYYDAAWVPRVRAIKRLQTTLHLPLHVIRQVLDRVAADALPDDVALEATIVRVLDELAPAKTVTRAKLLEGGVDPAELDLFVALGVLTPERKGKSEIYRGDDVSLLELLAQARRQGLTARMLPPEILRSYVAALQELVRVELQMFRAGVLPLAGDDVGKLGEVATVLSERLVVLLRRKLLLPTLRGLVERARPLPGDES
jgi:DNA-binding transcriptional MerR regulator